jgi:CheY-like chemotaxis protein
MPPDQPPPALLVVDDTSSIRQLLTHLLHDVTPWEVIAVPDAAAALAVLATRPVPLVIADYHLPDMIGDALAAAIKAQSPATKVVIITADIAIGDTSQWQNVDVCLMKPFPLPELVTVVGKLLPGDTRERVVGRQKRAAH